MERSNLYVPSTVDQVVAMLDAAIGGWGAVHDGATAGAADEADRRAKRHEPEAADSGG